MPIRDVKQIDDAELQAIYAADYWVPPRCDLLGSPLDLVQFDTAVNMGVGRAVRFLQSSIGCFIDGDFGPGTERALAVCDVGSTVTVYCQRREAFYRGLAESKPQMSVFLKGWMNRLNALRKEAGLPGFESIDTPVSFGDAEYIARVPDVGEDPSIDD